MCFVPRERNPRPAKERRDGPPTSRFIVNWSAGRATHQGPIYNAPQLGSSLKLVRPLLTAFSGVVGGHASLVIPGFETGDCTGWTVGGRSTKRKLQLENT